VKQQQIHHEVLAAIKFLGHVNYSMLTLIILPLNNLTTKYFIA